MYVSIIIVHEIAFMCVCNFLIINYSPQTNASWANFIALILRVTLYH